MTSSLDTMRKTKHRLWGSKIISSSWNFAHYLKTASSTTFIPFFFENFVKLLILWPFFQKSDFLKCLVSKNQISNIWDSHLCRPYFVMYYISFACICFKNYIFGEFSNTYLLSAQNRVKWRHKIRTISKNVWPILIFCMRRRQIDARRGVPSFVSIQ